MKTSEIQSLVKIVEDSDIDELEVSRWGHKIRITKNKNHTANSQGTQQISVPVQTPENNPQVTAAQNPGQRAQSEQVSHADDNGAPSKEEFSKEDYEEVKSPIVGTFYRAPNPEDTPFVDVGDSVKVGQTLCIVEAMKIMNEIESEVSGTVKEILVDNAEPIEYNQTLFLIEAS